MNLPHIPAGSASGWRPVDPPRRPVLFVNPRSDGGKAARAGLAEEARERGVEAVVLDPGHDLAALARDAAAGGADVLGVAGGDGSLAVVAAVAATHGIAFACVPAGTRDHFALDVGCGPARPDRPARDRGPRRTRQHLPPPRTGLDRVAPGGECPGGGTRRVDGEAVDLSPPLRFAIRPAGLRVRISSRHPGASPSARLRFPGPLPPPRGSQD